MASTLGALPDTLFAGETLLVASIIAAGYLPATHSLVYSFDSPTAQSVTATALGSGLGWTLTQSAANTLLWPAGAIHFVGLATLTASPNTVTAIDSGIIAVTASPTQATTWYATALAAVEAKMAGRASSTQQNFTLGDMSVGYMTWEQLITARNWLKGELQKLTGNRIKRRIHTRFDGVGV